MDFLLMQRELRVKGYSSATANARIAHDLILNAIKLAGFKEKVTIKGGVVMSGMSKDVRRATMDMDLDFLHYSLGEAAVRRFVTKLNRFAGCKVEIVGEIVELKQQEYRGKRLHLALTDENGIVVRTKIDIGVHTREDVKQRDFGFELVSHKSLVRLFVNSREQIFVEKLKSLLRLGSVSSRYKDVYDMYYLSGEIRKRVLKQYIRQYVFADDKMYENDIASVVRRLDKVFSNKMFVRQLMQPKNAWLNVNVTTMISGLMKFIASL